MNLLDARRRAPRISVDGFCGVASEHDVQPAAFTDLSTLGLRVERMFDPRAARPARPDLSGRAASPKATRSWIVQLELELPGIDEVVWTSAHVTRAFLTPMGRTPDGQPRFWCRAGLRLGDTSRRERTMLRDYVIEQLVSRRAATG